MLWKIMVFFLLVIIFALLLKIFYMRKAIKEIKRGFSEKLYTDTNTPIMLSSYDKLVSSLANDINVELKELQKQKHRYIQGDKELKNAITNISHDLRTPLTTICGYLSLLDKEEKSEHIARQLSIIKNRTFALKQLVEELFRYTTIISDTENSVYTETVINNVLEDCISSYYAIFKEKGITPNINLCEQKRSRKISCRPCMMDTPLVLYLFIRRTITIKMRSSNYWTGSSVYLLLRSIGKIHCSFGNR